MRIAAIDIGTNSIHMIVVQVHPDLSFEIVDREKEMVRLGAGGLDGRLLTEASIRTAVLTMSKFRRLAESHAVDEIRAAATSATREAENGGDLLAAIAQETGIRAEVISGQKEARLIHLAAVYGVDTGRQSALVVDIGGGSVEVTVGTARRIRLSRSFKLGVIRLTERFIGSDPLSKGDERRLVAHIQAELQDCLARARRAGFARVIGTSGTMLSCGAMAWAAEHGEPPTDVRNLRVTARAVHRLRKTLTTLPLGERLKLPMLEAKRADLIVAGAVLLDTLLRALEVEELTLCDYALREGLVLDYIRRNRQHIAQVDRYPDVRRRSVIELCERCRHQPEHAGHVAGLAGALFDASRAVHGLGDREREWLEYAGLMHDVGVHISYTRHHKHSYYLIRNGDLRGFEPREIEIMALVARYHRHSPPKKTHEDFHRLEASDRQTVRVLSALLRLAESLERSHAQVVSSVKLRERGDDYLLTVRVRGDAELELWAAHRQSAPLAAVLGKPLHISTAWGPRPQPRRKAGRKRASRGRGTRAGATQRTGGRELAPRRSSPRTKADAKGPSPDSVTSN